MARATMSRGARSLRKSCGHERFPVLAEKDPAFTPEGFRDEKRFGLRMIENGGMKLNEFHIGHHDAGPPGHCHAIAGRHVGIAGVEIDFAAAAGRQDDTVRAVGEDFALLLVERVDAGATVFSGEPELRRGDQIDGVVVLEKGDLRMRPHCSQELLFDLSSGGVSSGESGVSSGLLRGPDSIPGGHRPRVDRK